MNAPTDTGSRSVWFLVLISGFLALQIPGCGGSALVEDACIITDDCANFNEREMEECVARGDGALEEASIYGCEDQYLEALECYVDEDDCNDVMACADEFLDYTDCVSDARDENVDVDVEDEETEPTPPQSE